jgi:hypothetical protein
MLLPAAAVRRLWRRQYYSTATNRQIICVNCEETMEKAFPSFPPLMAPLSEKKNVVDGLVVLFFFSSFFLHDGSVCAIN